MYHEFCQETRKLIFPLTKFNNLREPNLPLTTLICRKMRKCLHNQKNRCIFALGRILFRVYSLDYSI